MEIDKGLFFNNRKEWREWLDENHSKASEALLIHYKKSYNRGLNHFDAVEEAICFGWIDSKLKKIDEDHRIFFDKVLDFINFSQDEEESQNFQDLYPRKRTKAQTLNLNHYDGIGPYGFRIRKKNKK